MSISKGLRNVVLWMGARRRYNHKRIEFQQRTAATRKAEATAEATTALAERFTKKCEQELASLRHECTLMRKKAETIAKFATELITSPADTNKKIDALEDKLLTEFKAVRARLGISPKTDDWRRVEGNPMIEAHLGKLTLALLAIYGLAWVKERTSVPAKLRSAFTYLRAMF